LNDKPNKRFEKEEEINDFTVVTGKQKKDFKSRATGESSFAGGNSKQRY
jgi:hypothetical protein